MVWLRSLAVGCLAALLLSGCGFDGLADPAPARSGSPVSTDSLTSLRTPYGEVHGPIRRITLWFAITVCTFDTTKVERTDFLADADRLSTEAERVALRHSQRARLPWRSMRARRELQWVNPIGLSWASRSGSEAVVVLNALQVTESTLGTVREPARMEMSLVRAGTTWKVTAAEGGCL